LANEYAIAHLPEGRFISMAALMVDVRSGDIECINAGHPPILVIGSDGKLRELDGGNNFAFGLDPAPLQCATARLEKGDVVAIYSDGWTDLETPAGEMLGTQRVNDCIAKISSGGSKQSLDHVLKNIVAQLDSHAGPCLANDDRSLIL